MIEKYTLSEPQQDWGIGGTLEASLNDVFPKPETDADGSPAWAPIEKLGLDCDKILSALRPSASARRKGRLNAVVSRAVYRAHLHRPLPRQPVAISLRAETAAAPDGLSNIRQRHQ